MLCLLSFLTLLFAVSTAHAQFLPAGLAKVDITPDYPIRLAGFGSRRTESEGVTCRIWAKALVIGDKDPVLVLTLDACGVSHAFGEDVAARLKDRLHLPRERFALTVTHSHTAPMIAGYLPTLFGLPIPPEHLAHIQRYTEELKTKLVQVAEQAWNHREPARLSWGIGTATFAANRRTRGGPVDHDLPLLAIHDPTGKLRGVWLNYACHCVTLSNNRISGDWAGFAAEELEQEHPGVTALVSVGCGADSNPDSGVTGDKVEIARKQGGYVAAEVRRLLGSPLAPVPGRITTKYDTFDLPLAALPSEAEFRERARRNDAIGYHARVQLGRLARGEKLPTTIPYSVQTWAFGDALAMVFLPGEVVVDYALRLKHELYGQRLWINGYANQVPCYIPSERILKEGGYEGGSAMTYYDLPGPFAAGLEDKIITGVKRQLEPAFRPPYDPNKLGGSKPLSPQQSAALVKVRDGLTAELMVAEPLVQSPVALSFGPDGKLWVAEMRDYPQGKDGHFQPGGCVKLLESSRGDWHYDKATVFLDNIPFPTGVTAWRKGVLVCAAPDILYAEDTNGDGKADVVKKLYSGFGTHNYQARVNSLEYGLDGWVHGSCGLFGGAIKSFNGKTYQLGNRDFRIRPDTGELEPATGQTQQGRVRDDFDNWFGCDNSNLGRHYVLADHYLRRNPAVKPPPAGVSVALGQDASRLFPLRQQVQLFQLSGPPGLPTAACGIGIYRDDLLGETLRGNLFTCEPVNLVVHRLLLKHRGTSFIGHRSVTEDKSEFLASTDNWFRPVQVRTGPDGCLWVVDMYRLVIEHPQWVPPADVARLDVRAGSTMGRIYRIKPSDREVRPMRRLDQMSAREISKELASPNGTLRDLAMMELIWRKSPVEVQEFLSLYSKAARPEVRAQLLCTLEQLGILPAPLVLLGTMDPAPGVQRIALRLTEALDSSTTIPDLHQRILDAREGNRVSNSSAVRLQLALTLGEWKDPAVATLLGKLLLDSQGDPYLAAAVLSSVRPEHHDAFLREILSSDNPSRAAALQAALPVLIHGQSDSHVLQLLHQLSRAGSPGTERWQYQAIATILQQRPGLRGDGVKTQKDLEPLYASARKVVGDDNAPAEDRVAAAGVLLGPGQAETDLEQSRAMLFRLLAASQAPELQRTAFEQLAAHVDTAIGERLCKQWAIYSPTLRTRLVDLLLSRRELQKLLIDAIAVHKDIPAAHLDASSKQRLLMSSDPAIRVAAETVFSATSADRVAIIQRYTRQVSARGDSAKGKLVFGRVCAACHRVGDQGNVVGPDLAALANRQASYLLQEILDPNRNLDSRYVEYVAVTRQGRTLTGVLANESANSVTLKGKEGREETLLRTDLEELQASGKSLMPEGLEKEITPAEMNDLVTFLGTLNKPARTFAGNTPATVEPADGVLTLRATQAEIHGERIAFEGEFQNVGMWHGTNDYVLWTVKVPKPGLYDVYFDWACTADSAGNGYSFEAGPAVLTGEVASTGGWSHYLRVRVGRVKLDAGLQQVRVRPAGPALHGALMDLRTVYLAPADHPLNLQEETSRRRPDYLALARQLLDDKTPGTGKQALIDQYAAHAPELVAAMTADLPNNPKEEYRRIPMIWRVAFTAGQRNDTATLRRLLDVALPKDGRPLRDWQAVVVGGGVINGISHLDLWPRERVKELMSDTSMTARWSRTVKLARVMADDAKTPTGTRYDALRIVAMDEPSRAVEHLQKYLPAGGVDELQMGAVSGLVDVRSPEADRLLAAALAHLKGENLRLAVDGLLRTYDRALLLLEQFEAGKVAKQAWSTAQARKLLARSKEKNQETQRKYEELDRRFKRVLGDR